MKQRSAKRVKTVRFDDTELERPDGGDDEGGADSGGGAILEMCAGGGDYGS